MKQRSDICSYWFIIMLSVICVGLYSGHAKGQNIRPISGVIAATTAPVQVVYHDASGHSIGRQADTGDHIFLNDEIMTGQAVTMQVMLKDQTVFTMGPNSSIRFDRFIYDPENAGQGAISANILNGSFKFISGKIADNNPDGMVIKLSHTTAAIRGTSVAGRINEDGSASLLLLAGAISLYQNNDSEISSTDIFRSGWGVTISDDGLASEPFRFDDNAIANITNNLTPETIHDGSKDSKPAASRDNADKSDQQDAKNDSNAVDRSNVTDADKPDKDDKPDQKLAAKAVIADKIDDIETKADTIDLLKVALTDKDENIDLETLAELVLEDEKIKQYLDVPLENLKREDNVGVVFESDLLDIVLSGVTPYWLIYETSPTARLGNPVLGSDVADLISDQYAGKVQFSGIGVELSPVTGSGSAKLNYNLELDYDGLTIIGSYDIRNLNMGGNTYDDYSNSFSADITSGTIYKSNRLGVDDLPASIEDENANARLDVDEGLEELVLGEVGKIDPVSDQLSLHGQVFLNGAFGSISDGTTTFDGNLGKVDVTVREVDTSGTPSFTDNHLQASHVSAGDK